MAAEVTETVRRVGSGEVTLQIPLAMHEAVRWYRAQGAAMLYALACMSVLPSEVAQLIFQEYIMCEFTHLLPLLAAIERRKLVP